MNSTQSSRAGSIACDKRPRLSRIDPFCGFARGNIKSFSPRQYELSRIDPFCGFARGSIKSFPPRQYELDW